MPSDSDVSSNIEIERQFRVVDQMLSIHSILRDRYLRRSRVLQYTLLVIAILLNAVVFAADDVYRQFGLDPMKARLGRGIVSALVLAVSAVAALANLPERVRKQQDAVSLLAQAKLKYRNRSVAKSAFDSETEESLQRLFESTMPLLPPIPDAQFTRLKAHHVRKVELSRRISANPGAPLIILRVRLFIEGLISAVKGNK